MSYSIKEWLLTTFNPIQTLERWLKCLITKILTLSIWILHCISCSPVPFHCRLLKSSLCVPICFLFLKLFLAKMMGFALLYGAKSHVVWNEQRSQADDRLFFLRTTQSLAMFVHSGVIVQRKRENRKTREDCMGTLCCRGSHRFWRHKVRIKSLHNVAFSWPPEVNQGKTNLCTNSCF